jgi:tetratricopeptide (TPR) repeat protein
VASHDRYLRLTALAQRAFSRARLARALSLFAAAEDEAKTLGDRELVDRAFCNRCVVLLELDRLDGAAGELKHVLMRSRDPFTSWMAAYYTAQLYESEENISRALAYARRASELAEACGEPKALAASANLHGVLALRDSRFAEASDRFEQALQLADPSVDPVGTAVMRDNLGYCLMCTNRVSAGMNLSRDAAASLETTGARQFLAEVYQDLCFGALQQDQLNEAIVWGERALVFAREFGNTTAEKNTLMLLADATLDAGDDEQADVFLERLACHYSDFRGMKAFLRAFNVREAINLKA